MERRNTLQRELVLQTVRKLHTHATADEIYAELIKEHPSVGRGTVYRNLNILAEEGAILKVSVPEQADQYDFTTGMHYHIRCLRCRRIFDVDMEPLTDLEDRIIDKHGFTFLNWELSFTGICPACKETKAG